MTIKPLQFYLKNKSEKIITWEDVEKTVLKIVAKLKKDNFELAVQKATELGVSHIVPILCERSEKKSIHMERLQKIAVEASEQSGRGDVPQIHPVVGLTELLQGNMLPKTSDRPLSDVRPTNLTDWFRPKNKIVLHTSDESGNFQIQISNFQKENAQDELAVFIGPEGGFSDKEIGLFAEHSIPLASLGPQILRAETAVIAVSSLLLL